MDAPDVHVKKRQSQTVTENYLKYLNPVFPIALPSN